MISDVYFPRINGVSTSIKTFHKELTTLGHEVRLIAPAYGADNSPDWVYRIPSRYLPLDPEDRIMRPKYIKALHETLKQQNFDLVHIQTPFLAFYEGVKLARMLAIPCIATFYTHFEEYLYHYLPVVPKRAVRLAVRYFSRRQGNDVDAIIVPSRAIFDLLDRYGIQKPREIIATGLDDGFLKTGNGMDFRCNHGIDPGRPVLMHVGRIAHEKNIDFLIHMLADVRQKVPDILLVIAGEGPASSHLADLVKGLKIERNVLFVGYLDRETDLLDCYCAGDIFVFASNTETQGLVLLEAMAQGVPVVSTSVLGTRDILEPGAGVLIAQEDRQDFAGKVLQLLRNPVQRTQLAEQARCYARTWTARTYARKTESFYRMIIDGYRLN